MKKIILLLFIIFNSQVANAWVVSNACIGDWSMNDNAATSTVVDTSGQARHGTMKANNTAINTDTVDATGKINGALTFNGTTNERNVELPFLYAFNRADTFSIEAWIQTTGTGEQNIISNFNNASPGGWILQLNTDQLDFIFVRNSFTSTTWIRNQTSGLSLNDGEWWHVFATYDGSSTSTGIKVYASKTSTIEEATDNPNATTINGDPTTEYKCAIGARVRTGDTREQEFNGLIDNIRIYNRVLTLAEIQALHNAGFGTERRRGIMLTP